MGDIYFSDRRRNKNNGSNDNDSNDFIETDYYDEDFSLKFNKGKGNPQSFIPRSEEKRAQHSASDNSFSDFVSPSDYVPISEHPVPPGTSHVVSGLDRTPHGSPVSSNRTVPPSHPQQSGSISSAPRRPAPPYGSRNISSSGAQPSRQPMGRPVQPQPTPTARPQSTAQTPSHSNPHVQRKPDIQPQNHTKASADSHASPAPRASQRSQGTADPQGSSRPPVRPKSSAAKRRSSSWKVKLGLAVVAVFAVVFLCLFGYAYSLLGGLNYDSEIIENRYIDSTAVSDPSLTNILFIGSDARGDVSGQRSDTMILFSIDKNNGQIKLASFLRDSYVYIPMLERKSKINAAFSNGGAQATIDTIEYNYNIDIDNYIIIDFVVFEQIVDSLGGITVDVTANEAKYMREAVKIPWVKEGPNDFNGFVSLWYCRIRHLDNDFRRTERQRKVISAVIDKIKSNPMAVPKMLKTVMPNISTDLTKSDIMNLGMGVLSYLRYDIVQQQVPAPGTWNDAYVNGSYVIKFNEEENKRILREFLLNKVEKKEEAK